MSDEITTADVERWAAGKVELKDLIGLDAAELEGLQGRAQFFLDGKHDERALIMLEMLEELDRTDPLPTLLAVEVLLRLGRSDAAEEKVEALLRRRPGDPDPAANKTVRFVPMKRAGAAEDLAGLAVYLASESTGYISGQILYVDGGLSTHL